MSLRLLIFNQIQAERDEENCFDRQKKKTKEPRVKQQHKLQQINCGNGSVKEREKRQRRGGEKKMLCKRRDIND